MQAAFIGPVFKRKEVCMDEIRTLKKVRWYDPGEEKTILFWVFVVFVVAVLLRFAITL